MKLYFINQHFPPDVAPTGRLIHELAQELTSKYKIHVLTDFPSYQKTNVALQSHEIVDAVEITRFGNSAPGRQKTRSRFIGYALFLVRAFFFLVFHAKRSDTIVTLTTPPFAGILGFVAKKLKGSRFIYWAMDLHPEAEVAVGWVKKHGILHRLLKHIHRRVLTSTDTIVVLGDFMKQRLLNEYSSISDKDIAIIPTWEKSFEFDYSPPKYEKFTINYSGNLGLVHDIAFFKSVILSLKDYEDIEFTFSGSGPSQHDLKSFLEKNEVINVRFMDYQDMESHQKHLIRSHLHWFSLKENCGGIAVPSKLAPYVLSGNPVLFCGPTDSEPFHFIKENRCGISLNNNDYNKATDFILKIKNDENLFSEVRKFTSKAAQNLPRLEQIVSLWFTLLSKSSISNEI